MIVILLEEWCAQWKVEPELQPQIIGHENNGRFLQTSPKDAIVLAMTLEASFCDCSEQIQIGVPYYTFGGEWPGSVGNPNRDNGTGCGLPEVGPRP